MLKALALQLTPDNEGALVRGLVWFFGANWKTSLNGVLSGTAVTLLALSGLLEALARIFEADPKVSIWIAIMAAIVVFLLALCRGWVGLLQVDAGHQEIQLPNSKETVLAPSHEIPDDAPPGSKIVK